MNDMSNRTRSHAVRSAAQAHLAALREERMAKRRAARSRGREPELHAAEPHETPLAEPQDVVDDQQPQHGAETHDGDDIAAVIPQDSAEDETAVEVESEDQDSCDDPVETSDDIEEGGGEVAENDDAKSSPDDAAAPAESTDLDQISGIGPGLISMLQDAGIGSLADLAGADAAELEAKLGLVGELLDLEFWIAEAARLQSTAA